ncbi:MAG: hypothetical protein AB7V27_03290 [Candidatus Binatia bacterium]
MRLIGALFISLAVALPASAAEDLVKDPDGKTLAIVVDCNSCKDGKDKECSTGVDAGFHDAKPCGKCLIDANFPTRIEYPYDLQFMGYLRDEKGEPLKGKFVRLYLPNTWTVRTRTLDDGMFRLLLGATAERKGKPLAIKLGDRVMPKDSKAAEYALYMLPPNYKPCQANGGTAGKPAAPAQARQ